MKLSLAVVVLGSLFGAALIGCASADPSPRASESEGEPAAAEDDLRGTCAAPRRYMAAVTEHDCTEVPAARGRWTPTPLFADAPPGTGACFYTWYGEKNAPVDRASLQDHVGWAGALIPSACGSEHLEQLQVEPAVDFDPGSMVGAVGCDVCGMQKDGHVWVIIPPERTSFHVVTVPLSNGTKLSFQMKKADAVRAATLTLPPPPAGAHYVNGRISVM